MTRYLLDSNIFIEAKNRYYGFDFCPAFWDWLIAKNAASQVFSIEKVANELQAGNDDLSTWAVARGGSFFVPPDQTVLPALPRVSAWVNGQSYDPSGVAIFLQAADYWLIAHALAHNFTVVTHEVPSPSIRRVKIPNVCVGLNVSFVNPFEMLRHERARFVLGT